MSSSTGSHAPTFRQPYECGGCGRPMICTRTGLWECDHNGGPPAGDGLPGVGATPPAPKRPRRVIELPPINGHIGSDKAPRIGRWTG